MAAHAPLVLVVDGSPQILEFMVLLLTAEGYQACAAETLEQVEHTLDARRPDLVIADVSVPGLRPFMVVDHLDAVPRTRGIPLILCTAALHELRREPHRLRRPRTEVLRKPFDLDQLFLCVDRLLAIDHPTVAPPNPHHTC